MDKEFSEGFMKDIAGLLELCMKNNTDNIELNFNINGRELNIDITFSIIKNDGLSVKEMTENDNGRDKDK